MDDQAAQKARGSPEFSLLMKLSEEEGGKEVA